jgi:ABC-2 type transport system ATP-binding protein
MLSIEGLVVRRGSAEVLRGVDLPLEPGRVHGLVGRNGAGKTTLLDALYGFVPAAAGAVRFGARPALPTDIGYLTAENVFYPRITGREYLALFAAARTFDVQGWGALFELPLDRPVDAYSTGMKKKLALLGILSLGRPVLALDEPFNGLDLETNRLLARLLAMLAEEGRTVLLTSHVLESLTSTCHRIHLLDAGRIAARYAAADFPRLEADLARGDAARLDQLRGLLGRKSA